MKGLDIYLYYGYILDMQFIPTKAEEKIFELLMNVVVSKTPTTILRIAGGIIRDRLLNIESSDIDIAVSDMSGLNFANLVVEYLKENGISYKNPTVIKANPDQSKHLETAMLEIDGLSIDFVNLRKETYTESRIPVIEIGTVEEDANRRDLTINALFYNLNTKSIEDYVGGLNDLYNRIAKTPIDPIKTYTDDPLRLYRCIRFAAKYNLSVENNIIDAAKNFNVVESLRNKISPERIFKEIGGYILPNGEWKNGCFSKYYISADALELMEKMDILHILFEDCHINFYMSHYYLKYTEHLYFKSDQDVLVYTLAIILRQNPESQITEALLKIKCPKNIIERINILLDSAKYIKFNEHTDSNIRKFLRKIKGDYRLALFLLEIDYMNNNDFINIEQKVNSNIEKYGFKIKPPITGQDLLNNGFISGKELGKALGALDDALLDNPEMSIEEALEFCKKFKS